MNDRTAILDFLSDNVSPATPEVIAAVVQANNDNAVPYGEDELTARPGGSSSGACSTAAS